MGWAMVGFHLRMAAVAAVCAALAGCASDQTPAYGDYETSGGAVAVPDVPLQCVPYARARSHVAIYGDAYTWWQQAAGRYARAGAPSQGAVMVLYNYAGPDRAHVAVVRQLVNAREIRVDHANWLDDGAIYLNDAVRDVSAANDWSQVRVYNLKAEAWGGRVYAVQGFIGPGPDDDAPANVARSNGRHDLIADLIAADNTAAGEKNELLQ
jgi:hypothetical protein